MNPVVWFEIYVDNMDRARAFYEKVLAKPLEKMDDPGGTSQMWAFPAGGPESPGAAGALVKMDGMGPSGGGTMVYLGCADCAVEAGRIEAAGGKVYQPKFAIGPYGFIVIAGDTEGNTFGLHSMA
jgi:uncharacterized protein